MRKISFFLLFSTFITSVSAQTNTFPASGSVGIGTLTPAAPLHVEGNLTMGSSAASTYHKLIINGPNTPNNIGSKRDISFEFAAAGSSLIRSYRGTSYDTYLQFLTTPNTTNTPIERMHINHDGKIGIGTISPTEMLEVIGNIKSYRGSFTGQTAGASFSHGSLELREIGGVTTNQSSDDYAPRLTFHWSGRLSSSIAMGTSGNLKFNAQGSTTNFTGIEVGNIFSYGNVAINTATVPTGYKLAVKGNVIAEKLVVKTSTAWPDFVFKNEYKLPSLVEVEQFISKNSHLPEIPSAKEVESNGQDVGEMNRLLLKKVEEITLYLIELKKENQEMKKENDSLKRRIEKLEK